MTLPAVTVEYSIDNRTTWIGMGTTSAAGIHAYSTTTNLPINPFFSIRIGWNAASYLYLATTDFGDACVNHRLRKVELALRASPGGNNLYLDDITLWVEPIVERQPYLTVTCLVQRDSSPPSGTDIRRSVYKQFAELSALLDNPVTTQEPPPVTVILDDPFGKKWNAMVTNITEHGIMTPADGPPGDVVTIEFLLLNRIT